MKNYLLFALLLTLSVSQLIAQTISPAILSKKWDAYWITAAEAHQHDYGVYHFRKTISLDDKPASFVVHISADSPHPGTLKKAEGAMPHPKGEIKVSYSINAKGKFNAVVSILKKLRVFLYGRGKSMY